MRSAAVRVDGSFISKTRKVAVAGLSLRSKAARGWSEVLSRKRPMLWPPIAFWCSSTVSVEPAATVVGGSTNSALRGTLLASTLPAIAQPGPALGFGAAFLPLAAGAASSTRLLIG